MSNYASPPQYDRRPGGVEHGSNRTDVPTFLFDFYTHDRPTLRHLVTIHNGADRQTERLE